MTCDKTCTLFGENFEASVCDSTKGLRLGAIEEVKNVQWCEEETFDVRLSYDSDLSQMVEIF